MLVFAEVEDLEFGELEYLPPISCCHARTACGSPSTYHLGEMVESVPSYVQIANLVALNDLAGQCDGDIV